MTSQHSFSGTRRSLLISGASIAGLSVAPRLVSAANFPEAPIKIVVPFPPGGTVDTLGRIIAPTFGSQIKQQVIIENKGGAGSIIGSQQVNQATPNGYTLLLNAANHVVTPLISNAVPFNPIKDFTPICYIGFVPQLVVVRSEFPASTFEDFIKLVKEKPGQYSWATASIGTTGHLAEELINQRAGLKMQVIAYRGGGPALTDVIAGHTTAMVEPVPSAIQHVKSGRLKILAVTSAQRAPSLPQVPTVSESGLPGFELPSWYGIWGPAKLPAEITNKLYADLKATLTSPALKDRFADLSFVAVAGSPEELGKLMQTETEKYASIVKTAKIVMD